MGSISVSNLGKAYKQYPTRWSRLVEWFDPRGVPRHQNHWVLNDVSFSISAGEAVGILGVNGAGKSTLLKMITGTTQPTTGSVHRTGSLAALLELGMGFHPDFTGRQNVLMAGQLLGMHAEEIATLMPEIESFAAIGDYIDQPVRVYSSGMQVRLAFAVATCKRPDILIVDEALSVGDTAFQRKCYQRIEGFRSQGTTLLFVTHDIETVKKICDRALFIKNGVLYQLGAAKEVCDEYERFLFGTTKGGGSKRASTPQPRAQSARYDPALVASCATIYGDGKANISDIRLEDDFAHLANVVQTGDDLYIRFEVAVGNMAIARPSIHLQIKTADGVVIYGINTDHLQEELIQLTALKSYQAAFKLENKLAPGNYFITCGIKEGGVNSDSFCCRVVDGAIFKVTDRDISTVARGLIDLRASFTMSQLAE